MNPPRFGFAEAVREIHASIARDRADAAIDPRGYPRLYDHGRRTARSVVLFHGLTNCPQQFDAFAQELHARGDTVYVPRLPFHGYRDRLTRAPAALTSSDVLRAATAAARLAAGLGETVAVAGISVGATMALWLAQTEAIGNAVAVAPFLMLPVVPYPAGMLVVRLLQALPDRFLWWDPRKKERLEPPYAYPGFWTHCLAQALVAGSALRAAAARSAPLGRRCTVVLNAHDPAVNNGVARRLVTVWNRHGAAYTPVTWDDVGRAHDIIDPAGDPAAPALVYPRLVTLLNV